MVMKDIIKKFPSQILDSVKIAENISLNKDYSNVQNIVIAGQGGSAIGGVMVKNLLSKISSLPIIINQDYNIPNFINKNTLFIASSYSGNTEETLSALRVAKNKTNMIVSICSGGDLLKITKKNNFDYILIPAGGVPRAMLCYSLTQMLFLIYMVHGLTIQDLKTQLIQVQKNLSNQQDKIMLLAENIASSISNKMPFIYTYSEFEGVALRLKQQLNENSKRHACYNLIPEMNHNEIVPWIKQNLCVIPIFLNGFASFRNKKRMEITLHEINKSVDDILEFTTGEESYFEQYFYFIHLIDFVSVSLAEIEGVDPYNIDLIDSLKKQLKSI